MPNALWLGLLLGEVADRRDPTLLFDCMLCHTHVLQYTRRSPHPFGGTSIKIKLIIPTRETKTRLNAELRAKKAEKILD